MEAVYTPASFLVTIPRELQVLGLTRKVRFYETIDYDANPTFTLTMTKEKMIEHIDLIVTWMRTSTWKSKFVFTIAARSDTHVLRIDRDKVKCRNLAEIDISDDDDFDEDVCPACSTPFRLDVDDANCYDCGEPRRCRKSGKSENLEPGEMVNLLNGEHFRNPDTKFELEIVYDGVYTKNRTCVKAPVWKGKSQEEVDEIAKFDAGAKRLLAEAEQHLAERAIEFQSALDVEKSAAVNPASTTIPDTPTKIARSVGFTEW